MFQTVGIGAGVGVGSILLVSGVGIDFRGGAMIRLETNLSVTQVRKEIAPLKLEDLVVQSLGKREIIIRAKDINEKMHQRIMQALKGKAKENVLIITYPTISKDNTVGTSL